MSNKPHCLVIEDDEDLSVIFSEALKAAGFETEILRDGQDAMNRVKETTPAILILDMHLPRVSGLEILNYVRTEARTELTNVVVVTADAVMAEQVRESADFVLIKPITFGQLRDLTSRLHLTPPADSKE